MGMIGQEQWDEASSTPFLRWHDNDPELELWYDNPRSLALKSEFARSVGAGGVSMWNANSINYENASQVAAFWGSFRPFTGYD
jgi:GH18 family chitinase